MSIEEAAILLSDAYYVDLRAKRLRDGGREYAVGVQWSKGGPVMRVTDTDLGRAVREAVSQARSLSGDCSTT